MQNWNLLKRFLIADAVLLVLCCWSLAFVLNAMPLEDGEGQASSEGEPGPEQVTTSLETIYIVIVVPGATSTRPPPTRTRPPTATRTLTPTITRTPTQTPTDEPTRAPYIFQTPVVILPAPNH